MSDERYDEALRKLADAQVAAQALQERAEKAETALKEALVVIGAAALTAGGFLRISRKAMTEIDLDGELSSWGEPDAIVYTYHPPPPFVGTVDEAIAYLEEPETDRERIARLESQNQALQEEKEGFERAHTAAMLLASRLDAKCAALQERAERAEARAKDGRMLVESMDRRMAERETSDEDGWITGYQLPVGPWHRLLAWARQGEPAPTQETDRKSGQSDEVGAVSANPATQETDPE